MEKGEGQREQREGTDGQQHAGLLAYFNRRRITPVQRRIARYISHHPYEAPFLSSSELALRAGVSQPSVIRLSSALGHPRYTDFQGELRRILLSPAEERVSSENKFQSAVTAEISNLRALQDFLAKEETVLDVGRKLAASDPLVVLGLRASAPMAGYFGYFAQKIHPNAQLLTSGGSTVFDQLAHAHRAGGEWVLCFLLPRHPRETLEAALHARELGFRLATITDRPPETISRASDVLLPVEVGTQLVFDSQAAAMVLVGALLEAISDAFPARTQERLEDFEQRATGHGWFVQG